MLQNVFRGPEDAAHGLPDPWKGSGGWVVAVAPWWTLRLLAPRACCVGALALPWVNGRNVIAGAGEDWAQREQVSNGNEKKQVSCMSPSPKYLELA